MADIVQVNGGTVSIQLLKGEILSDDMSTVEDCAFNELSVLRVIDRLGIDITVTTPDGRSIAIPIRPSDTMNYLKMKIREKVRFNDEEHELIFNGSRLADGDTTIDKCGIIGNSVIKVVNRSERRDGAMCDNVRDDTNRWRVMFGGGIPHDEEGIADLSKITLERDVQAMQNCGIGFERTRSDTIIDIKKINEKIRPLLNEHKLVSQGGRLEDDKNPECRWVCAMSAAPILRIFAKTNDGKKITFEVMEHDRIIDIKKKIHEKIGLSPDEQKLVYKDEILEDDKTVKEYGIVKKSVINVESILRRDVQIFVRTNNMTEILRVSNCDTIIDIKKKIHDEIGISPDVQIINVNGTIIRNDNSRLYNYGITTNSYIDVSVASKINITIMTHNTETVRLEVLNIDRIIDIKEKIFKKIGLPPDEQQLEYLGAIQSDDLFVCPFDIGGNSDLTLLPSRKQKTRGICLVISNEAFTNGAHHRPGTHLDEENIRDTFESMGYEIQIRQNVKSANMNTVIEDTKNLVEGSHKMLIVFILSHGDETGVVTVDGAVIPYKNIWMPFSNANFCKLAGKPKIIFFVCCRGSNKDDGVSVQEVQYDGPTTNGTRHPAMGDLFIGYAAFQSYVSFRHCTQGTFYVNALCDVIRCNRLWSVSDIHQEVQTILESKCRNGIKGFQTPCYENSLTKHAYFYDDNCVVDSKQTITPGRQCSLM